MTGEGLGGLYKSDSDQYWPADLLLNSQTITVDTFQTDEVHIHDYAYRTHPSHKD